MEISVIYVCSFYEHKGCRLISAAPTYRPMDYDDTYIPATVYLTLKVYCKRSRTVYATLRQYTEIVLLNKLTLGGKNNQELINNIPCCCDIKIKLKD